MQYINRASGVRKTVTERVDFVTKRAGTVPRIDVGYLFPSVLSERVSLGSWSFTGEEEDELIFEIGQVEVMTALF